MKEKILVVDDDPAIIRLVRMVLEKHDYEVTSATSGEEALQLAIIAQPDLIILDVSMPGGWSGFDTCKKFKSNATLLPIPIIFLTAKVEQFEEGFELGGADYVLKPFNQKELIVRAQFHLKMRNLVNQIQLINENLEHKVQARTQDLTHANQRLNQVINERKVLENRLKNVASNDALTNLSSGVTFENSLQTILDSQDRATQTGALLYLDLVKFETINQRFGWTAGDEVLVAVGNLLQSQFGSAALISRPGGDQFAIYIKKASASAAKTIARGLMDCIDSFPFTWQGNKVEVNAYIGFCLANDIKYSARDILSKAIQATVIGKEQGAGAIVDYHQHAASQDSLENEQNWIYQVEQALESNNFSLYYQQVQPLSESDNRQPSLEVLLRLTSGISDRLMLPSEIFGFSGSNQIKSKIDFWVIKEVLGWLKNNSKLTAQYSHISLNLTAETMINPLFLITLENLLEANSVPNNFLCFEISEPDILHSIDRSRALLSRLKALGCLTCIDDFGGQSAIYQHLAQLDIDYLKIDGSFMRNLANSPINVALYKMLKEISTTTGIPLIAKRVEDKSMVAALQSLGIDYAQGHYLHIPEPLSMLSEL